MNWVKVKNFCVRENIMKYNCDYLLASKGNELSDLPSEFLILKFHSFHSFHSVSLIIFKYISILLYIEFFLFLT